MNSAMPSFAPILWTAGISPSRMSWQEWRRRQGFPKQEAREILQTRAFSDAVDADWALARSMGITAGPDLRHRFRSTGRGAALRGARTAPARPGGEKKKMNPGCSITVICCVALQTSSLDVFYYTPRSSVFACLASNRPVSSKGQAFEQPVKRRGKGLRLIV